MAYPVINEPHGDFLHSGHPEPNGHIGLVIMPINFINTVAATSKWIIWEENNLFYLNFINVRFYESNHIWQNISLKFIPRGLIEKN